MAGRHNMVDFTQEEIDRLFDVLSSLSDLMRPGVPGFSLPAAWDMVHDRCLHGYRTWTCFQLPRRSTHASEQSKNKNYYWNCMQLSIHQSRKLTSCLEADITSSTLIIKGKMRCIDSPTSSSSRRSNVAVYMDNEFKNLRQFVEASSSMDRRCCYE